MVFSGSGLEPSTARFRRTVRGNRLKAALQAFVAAVLVSGMIPERAVSAPTVALYRGGSDFPFYGTDGCRPNNYTVIANYGAHKAEIDSELQQMYKDGQRSIGLTMWFMHGGHGSTMDSSTGDLAPEGKANLRNLLATVKSVGFEHVKFNFAPEGDNYPFSGGSEWPNWRDDMYQEDLNVLKTVHAILAASGLPYVIQLGSLPAPRLGMTIRFYARLWRDYAALYGKQDTVGFAISTHGSKDNWPQIMPMLYGDNFPDLIGVSLVEQAADKAVSVSRWMTQFGLAEKPWVIVESLYNDPQEASELARVLPALHIRLEYSLQWPLSRARACGATDVPFPAQFDAYEAAGF
jgi:hypothetical protein